MSLVLSSSLSPASPAPQVKLVTLLAPLLPSLLRAVPPPPAVDPVAAAAAAAAPPAKGAPPPTASGPAAGSEGRYRLMLLVDPAMATLPWETLPQLVRLGDALFLRPESSWAVW